MLFCSRSECPLEHYFMVFVEKNHQSGYKRSHFHVSYMKRYLGRLRMSLVKLYDTTLRDGTQAEDISFLVEDKIRIAHRLDELGVHYIEGGWPGSNPKDVTFFKDIKKEKLSHAKIAAFGSTRRAKVTPDKDNNIITLIKAEPDAITIFGKTWDFHVREALRISLEENLELIFDSLEYLKKHTPEVFYDAEHFFDGY